MRRQVREALSAAVADWQHQGLIDKSHAETLTRRYDRQEAMGTLLLKWLGFFAIFMLSGSVLAFIGMVSAQASPIIPAVLLGIAAGVVWYLGSRMAADVEQKHPLTGSILLTVGLMGGYGCLSLLYLAGDGSRYDDIFPLFMIIIGIAALLTAYRYRLRWPLLLALLLFFHGIGSWHAYAGDGAYFAAIQDERSMAVIAFVTILLGLWHERTLEERELRRHIGFGHLYIIFGLLYVNLSLWFLTLPLGGLSWVLAFTIACVAQIVAGARLKDARFTGFGIVFLSIDMYTRFFEHFWDSLSLGLFFLIAGVFGMALGYSFEKLGYKT